MNVTLVGERTRYALLESIRAFAQRKWRRFSRGPTLRRPGAHWNAVVAALNLAATIALRGQLHVAVVLFGFLEDEFRRTNHKLSETDRASYEMLVASVRSKLPNLDLETFRAEGARLKFHEAVDLLLLSLRTA